MKFKKYFILAAAILTVSLIIFFLLFDKKDLNQNVQIVNYKPLWDSEKNSDKNYLFGDNIKELYDVKGNLYVFDMKTNEISKYDSNCNFVNKFGGKGQGPGEFVRPCDFSLDKDGYIYVADMGKGKIEILKNNGELYASFAYKPSVENVKVLAKNLDTIFVSSTKSEKIITGYNYKGEELFSFCDAQEEKTKLASVFANVVHLVVDNAGCIWVAFRSRPLIRKFSPLGVLLFEKSFASKNIIKMQIDEKNDPDNKISSFYFYFYDIKYADKFIYISSVGELLEVEPNTCELRRILTTSSENNEKKIYFNNIAYNPILHHLVFERNGVLNKIKDVLYE